jgi:hypothetical protein
VPFAGVAGFSNCHLGSKSYQTSCTRGTRVSTWRAWRATGMTGRRRHSPQALAAAGTRRRHSPFRLPHAKISGPQGGVKLAGGLNNFWQSSNLAVQNGFISRSGLGGGPSTIFGVLQHSVCTGTLVYLLHELKGPAPLVLNLCGVPHQILRKRPFLPSSARGSDRAGNCSCSCGEGCGGRAVAARRARRARDTVVGRPAPHARWSLVGHRTPQCFPR